MEIISGSSRLETELRLGLPGGSCEVERNEKKRGFSCFTDDNVGGGEVNSKKNQVVVGWPPVCAYRQKSMMKMYVKVSMDGAPFLRKIDLSMHKGYSHLALALEQLFGCVGIGNALKDAEDYEYVAIYEDKDDDWMMLGDVPWEMFAETCKRLRIMRKSDAMGSIGLHAEDLLKGLITKDE